jgi:sulfur-carrier protein
MNVDVLYFGELRETLETAGETVELDSESDKRLTVSDLINHLCRRSQVWETALRSSEPLRIAVNQEMAALSHPLTAGAEVAFFRPVTGG